VNALWFYLLKFPSMKSLRLGAVVFLDALGFEGIWTRAKLILVLNITATLDK
jgi:hypothetical protein